MPDTPPKPGLRREDLLEMWDCCLRISEHLKWCSSLDVTIQIDRMNEAIEKIKTNIKKCIDPEIK